MVDLKMTSRGALCRVVFNDTNINNADDISVAGKKIVEFVRTCGSSKVVFDFGRVRFFTPQVLGMLLNIRAQLQSQGVQLVISSVSPRLHKVFKVTCLDTVFRFSDDRSAACAAT